MRSGGVLVRGGRRVRAAAAGLAVAVLVAVVSVVPTPVAGAADPEIVTTVNSWADLAAAITAFNANVPSVNTTVNVIGPLTQGGSAALPSVSGGTASLTIRGWDPAGTGSPATRAITGNATGTAARLLFRSTNGPLVLQDLSVSGFTGLSFAGGDYQCMGALVGYNGTGSVTIERVTAVLTAPSGGGESCSYLWAPETGQLGAGGALVRVQQSSASLTIRGSVLRGSVGPAAGSQDASVLGGLVFAGGGTVLLDDVELRTASMTGSTVQGGLFHNSGGSTTIQGGTLVTSAVGGTPATVQATGTVLQGSAVYVGTLPATGSLVLDGSTVSSINGTVEGDAATARGTVYAPSATLRNGARIAGNLLMGDGARGAGLYAAGATTVTVEESTVEGNEARGDTGALGGGILAHGDVALLRSSVMDNVARAVTTGDPLGGGVYAETGTVTVDDSTVSGNEAVTGAAGAAAGPGKGDVLVAGGGVAASALRLQFATVTGNVPDQLHVGAFGLVGGDGPAKGGKNGSTSVASVVVGACSGTPLTSAGWNWVSSGTPCFAPNGTTDLQGADPGLPATPALNGGLTENFLPETGSPLIDGVSPAGCASVDAGVRTPDQRGVTRPQGVDAECDIGSVEVLYVPPSTTTTTTTTSTTVPPPPTPPGGGGGGGGGGGSPSPSGASVSRVYGPTAAGTAVALSQESFPLGAVVVFVATRASFADGLVGGVPAGLLPGPLLLVDADGVPPETAAEIRRLGATRIVVLGGPQAVSEAIYAELAALIGVSAQGVPADLVRAGQEAPRIERWAGPDRYATADVVAANTFPEGARRAFVATGQDFPDALAVVPAAISAPAPVLLTLRDGLPEATAQQLVALGVTRVTVVGGPEAVSEYVVSQLQFLGFQVDRIAGPDRYATAAAIGLLRGAAPTSWVASGLTFPDALSAGPVAGRAGQPLLLVSEVVPPVTSEALRELRTRTILVAGGPMAVSNSVVAALAATG